MNLFSLEGELGRGLGSIMEDKGGRSVVIISGASSGLGAALAKSLDRTCPAETVFWLIARDRERLTDFASSLNHPCQLLALDLRDPLSFDKIKEVLDQEKPCIDTLVNNAGLGSSGPYEGQACSDQESLCDLNIRAQLMMTSLALPYMTEGAGILFIASVAAFLPQPGFAAYAASKAFILSFGRALRQELKGRGIRVTVSCPNPMLTSFFSQEEKEALLRSYKRLGIEDPAKVAEKSLRALRKNQGVVVTSLTGKGIRLLAKILPKSWILPWIKAF